MKRLHAILSGRVQGVGFRYFALEEAAARRLTGWVRNRGEGQVEVMAEGPEPELSAFLEALRAGPPAARVDAAQVDWREGTGEFTGFHARASSH